MVAGERSGDLYGAELAAELARQAPELRVFGCGGDAMRGAGVETVVDARDFAMVGITEVISGLPRARRAFHAILDEVRRRRPALAVLIDSPSLNLRLAKRFKRRGVPVCYFVSPQVWAWKKWRMRHLRARVDKMLCIFDFEAEIYRRAGVPVEYVGHPLVDVLARPGLVQNASRQDFCAQAGLDPTKPVVALLPGSRRIELRYNLPAMLEAAGRLAANRYAQFVLAAAPALDAQWIELRVREAGLGGAIRVLTRSTYDALKYSDAAVVASGTATLEAALFGCPMVVVYRVAPTTAFFARFMIDVPFYSIVNLLARKRVVTELIQSDFTVPRLVSEIEYLLGHPEACDAMKREFDALRTRLGTGGASDRAAAAVVRMLDEPPAAASGRIPTR